MDFSRFQEKIKQLSKIPNPGIEAQFKLAPKIRKPYSEQFIATKNPKQAAVLALFYPEKNNKTHFLLTERASYNGTHSAQISFPGGKLDAADESLQKTALRETYEEVGILLGEEQIFKRMSNVFIPPSNFMVSPFLAYSNSPLFFSKNHEVESLIPIALEDLLCETSITKTTLSTSYANEMEVPCFKLNDYIVWGATAMMLSEIKELFNKI